MTLLASNPANCVATPRSCDVPASQNSAASEKQRLRSRSLMLTEIDFIPNRSFSLEEGSFDAQVTGILRETICSIDMANEPSAQSQQPLLDKQQEQALFRGMNYLKFRANALRTHIDPGRPDTVLLDEIESQLNQAQSIRDHLIKVNMRLLYSIAMKFVTPQQTFDDLVSEGVIVLMKTVEKFDFDRGFRFSTYAYRSIVRQVIRSVSLIQKEESRLTRDAEEWAFTGSKSQTSSAREDQAWNELRQMLASFINRLDRREQLVIRSRYALGAHRKVRTFQDLANRLGVTKERVRQLERRAVGKLRSLAMEHEHKDLMAIL